MTFSYEESLSSHKNSHLLIESQKLIYYLFLVSYIAFLPLNS